MKRKPLTNAINGAMYAPDSVPMIEDILLQVWQDHGLLL